MREIKYRGMTDKNEWVYGYPFYAKSISTWFMYLLNDKLKNPIVRGETIGQFTGKKDKNGKEIYDRDIYKDAEGIVSVVEMAVDGWALFPIKKDTPIRNLYWHNVCLKTQGEVIGNIPENPELGKAK